MRRKKKEEVENCSRRGEMSMIVWEWKDLSGIAKGGEGERCVEGCSGGGEKKRAGSYRRRGEKR